MSFHPLGQPVSRMRVAVVFGILAVAVAVLWLAYHGAWSRREAGREESARRFLTALDIASRAEFVPVQDAERIAGMARRACSAPDLPLSPTQRSELADAFTDFISSRFTLSPEAYVSSRERAGYGIRDLQDARHFVLYEYSYRHYLGADPPEADARAHHVRLMEAQRNFRNGSECLRGIAFPPDLTRVVVAKVTRSNPSGPDLPVLHGDALRRGPAVGTSYSWWNPPMTMNALLERDGEAIVANIATFGRFGDGKVRAVVFEYVHDPSTRQWWLLRAYLGADGPAGGPVALLF